MDDAPQLAALLRSLRSSSGLTQEELAEGAGISVRTVSDIERGLRRSVYRDTADRLAASLGIDPNERAEFVALARGRKGRFDPDTRRGGLPLSVRPIPSPPTRLIGREREVEVLLNAFDRASIRLLTLTGPGGIGKTRIAIEVSSRAQGMFRDGVFFLALASTDAAGVISSIARALGMTASEDPTVADVGEHLGAAKALVILDTFEHLLSAAPYVGDLISRCNGLTVLVTSREALHVLGEHVVPIAPLELPPSGGLVTTTNPSISLFTERAHAVKPDLDLSDRSVVAIVEICRRLGGLPLAIELAASRVQHMPLPALCDQLNSGLGVLSRGAIDLPPRQRTMRDTIGWSYQLLEPDERSLFRAVSVFAGGWTLEGAKQVWQATAAGVDTLGTMSALVDKSLVVSVADTSVPRFTMLEVIGEFAAEERERESESDALRRAHASFFLALAERAEKEVGSGEQETWYHWLAVEHDNLRRALRSASELGGSDLELRLAGALWQFWRAEGHFAEGLARIEEALGRGAHAPVDARAKALWGAAWLAFHQDDLRAAHRFSDQLTALTEPHERNIVRRNALTIAAMLQLAEGQFEAAVLPLRESVDICNAIGAQWLLATSKLNLALASMHTGRLEDANRLLEEASNQYLELGDERFLARSYVYLGHLRLLEASTSGADVHFSRGLQDFVALGDQHGMAEALEGLAAVNAARGNVEGAALLWGTATQIREQSTSRTQPFERALIERWLDEAKASLGERTWDATLSEGRKLDIDAALAQSSS